jgi:hypothetical protein
MRARQHAKAAASDEATEASDAMPSTRLLRVMEDEHGGKPHKGTVEMTTGVIST